MAHIPSQPNSQKATWGDPRTAYAAAEFIFGQLAKTITVFFRYDFGERYFNVVDILGSTFTMAAFAVFGAVIAEASGGKGRGVFYFILGFIVMSLIHRALAWWNKRSRPHWHSRYSGTSYLSLTGLNAVLQRDAVQFLGISERYIIQRYLEPIIAFAVGVLVGTFIDRALGVWLAFAALSLAAVEWLDAARGRDRILDAIDAQIEADAMATIITEGETDPRNTEGFALPVPTYFDDTQREKLYSGMTQLNPVLLEMMSDSKALKQGDAENE